jgi:hypothetical protein
MTRLYMLSYEFLHSKKVKIGEHWENGTMKPVEMALQTMFCPIFGSHAFFLDGDLLLLVTHFDHSPEFRSYFESLEEVAYLPDPTTEGTVKLKQYVNTADKHGYTQAHHDMLKKHVSITDQDTVHDLHDKASKLFAPMEFRVSPKPALYVDHI